MGDLLDGYRTDAGWDEMLESPDYPRAQYRTLFEQIQTLSRADFEETMRMRDRVFSDRGVTFAFSGEEERPFPLDLVPRVISAAEWSIVERGVGQRVLALEHFLADVYGPGEIMHDRVVPRRLVVTSKHFHRAVAGVEPAGDVRVHVAGIDSSATARAACAYSKTTCVPRRESRTSSRTGRAGRDRRHRHRPKPRLARSMARRVVPVDPTTGAEVGERHVLVARGRDYGDVAPLKGVFHGLAYLSVDVRVAIERVA